MDSNLMWAVGLLSFLTAVAAIDEMLEHDQTLGEEWDFVTPNNRRNS